MRLASRFDSKNQIRRDRPLTNDELASVVPSVFSEEKHDSRSDRYTYIPTIQLLDSLRKEGFQPFFACQTRVRDEARKGHTKHMLRLRRERQITGSEVPEIVLLNSHDGSSSYQMLPGIFRFVCANGMVCGEDFGEVRVPHKGDVTGQVIEGAYEVLGIFDKVDEHMNIMKDIPLNRDEQDLFAQAAVVQKSRNGDTIVVSDMTQALAAARGNPAAGVLLLTGRQMPSAQLLKVAGGVTDRTVRPDATLLRLVQSELQEILRYLPAEERPADESALLRQALRAIEETRHPPSEIQLPETKGQDVPALSAQLVERVVQNMQQEIPVLPGEKLPDYAALIRQASGLLAQNEALQDNNGAIRAVLATLAGAGQFASAVLPAENAQGSLVSAEALRYVQAEQDKAHGTAKNPQNDLSERALASAARELEKQGQLTLPPESRGREPEREEITHEAVRHIQKER